jgi:hypothetical protein
MIRALRAALGKSPDQASPYRAIISRLHCRLPLGIPHSFLASLFCRITLKAIWNCCFTLASSFRLAAGRGHGGHPGSQETASRPPSLGSCFMVIGLKKTISWTVLHIFLMPGSPEPEALLIRALMRNANPLFASEYPFPRRGLRSLSDVSLAISHDQMSSISFQPMRCFDS